MLRITCPVLGNIFIKFAFCVLYFWLSYPVDHGSWHFAAKSCGSFTLNIHFVWDPADPGSLNVALSWNPESLGSCWYLILNFCLIVISWRCWILISIIAKGSWRPWSYIFVLSWGFGDPGSRLSDFVVGSCRSCILTFYFVVGSCASWILIFGCGACLLRTCMPLSFRSIIVTLGMWENSCS